MEDGEGEQEDGSAQKSSAALFEGVTDWHQSLVTMSSATSDVTYTSVYTDSEPGRAFYWGKPMMKRDIGREATTGHRVTWIHVTCVVPEEIQRVVTRIDDDRGWSGEDYPMDGGDDGDDDDGDSSRDDPRDEDEDEEDEEEEEHLAPADSTTIIPADEPVFPPEGTEPIIPPPSTDITVGARIPSDPDFHSSSTRGMRFERLWP
ncbi:hypothetical protein Tco_0619854 [Tanacetum coccineum]